MQSAPNSPWLDPDELEVIRSLQDAGVRFVIIGGRAVQFHGHAREAKDLDLLVDLSAENWPRLQAALKPLNAGVPSFEELSPERKYQARLRFYETVELLTAVGGVSFEDA
jgi:predicted nucleotidyltransferase